jgi:hypothetical protein
LKLIQKINRRIQYRAADKPRRQKPLFRIAAAFFIFLIPGILPIAAVAASGDKPEKQSKAEIDFQRLEGRWVRPDGGYVLELQQIQNDGSVVAAYYNPRPIHVSRAEVSRKEGRLTLFVELRDVNYPGSTYTLQYDPVLDRLQGTYFLAMQKETFVIEFMRLK